MARANELDAVYADYTPHTGASPKGKPLWVLAAYTRWPPGVSQASDQPLALLYFLIVTTSPHHLTNLWLASTTPCFYLFVLSILRHFLQGADFTHYNNRSVRYWKDAYLFNLDYPQFPASTALERPLFVFTIFQISFFFWVWYYHSV